MMLTRMRLFLTRIKIKEVAKNLVIPFSFITPILMLFILDPNSFNYTWKGRTFYLFFLWLLFLELILNWERLQATKIDKMKSARTVAFTIALLIPAVYVIIANFYGLNYMIENLAEQNNITLARWIPLSTEYLVFAVLFALIVLLEYGISALRDFSISAAFLGIIGVIYTIDNVYPFGAFTPFQAFVPFTASSAAQILNWIGYKTSFLSNQVQGMPVLYVSGSSGSAGFGIGWPCAGVQSLFIYTLVILLFLKKSEIPLLHKIIYFIIGAIGTYIVNILRIVSIYIIAINQGMSAAQVFHNYYGELYSTTWIIAYLIIIILSRTLLAKLSVLKVKLKKTNDTT